MTITLTKDTAIELLKNMHPTQRDLNWDKVYTYKRRMDYGWFETDQCPSIAFCNMVRLKNGQHRVMAFLLSSLTTITFNFYCHNNWKALSKTLIKQKTK